MNGRIVRKLQQVLISDRLDVKIEGREFLFARPLESDSEAIRRDCREIGPSGKSRQRHQPEAETLAA